MWSQRGLNQFPLIDDEPDDNSSAGLFLDESGQKILTGWRGNPAGENADGYRESFLTSCEAGPDSLPSSGRVGSHL